MPQEPDQQPRQRRIFLDKSDPAAFAALREVGQTVRESALAAGLSPGLLELINIRVSQINRCAYCLRLHTKAARELGESAERLDVLPAWRDTELFSPKERAALAVAENVAGVPASEFPGGWDPVADGSLTPEEFSAVNWAAITIGAFNRISVVSRHPVRAAKKAGA